MQRGSLALPSPLLPNKPCPCCHAGLRPEIAPTAALGPQGQRRPRGARDESGPGDRRRPRQGQARDSSGGLGGKGFLNQPDQMTFLWGRLRGQGGKTVNRHSWELCEAGTFNIETVLRNMRGYHWNIEATVW